MNLLISRGKRGTGSLNSYLSHETIEVMFAGINTFWAGLRLILARAVRPGFKIFVPKSINCITIINTMEDIAKTV